MNLKKYKSKMYKVIATGSKGNAVIYHNSIMVDCGIPYSKLISYIYNLQLILLTHEHKDHLDISTIKKLAYERPTLRFGCCEWLYSKLEGIKNIDIYLVGNVYDYGNFKISPIKLYHDVENCGYRIFKGEHKIIHATDTAHLNGIEALNYDLYAIEHNYNEETIYNKIKEKQQAGKFAYEKGAINSHLSEQAASKFIYQNKGEKYEVLRLHESSLI